MDRLKSRFYEKAMAAIAEMKPFMKEHDDTIIDQVTIGQVFGGMRGIKSMLWETSLLDAEEGIRFRGYSIPELKTQSSLQRRRTSARRLILADAHR